MGKFTTPIEALELRRLLSAILRVDANSIAPNPDGATWDTAYPSLQQALAAANFGDEIRVADGLRAHPHAGPSGAPRRPGCTEICEFSRRHPTDLRCHRRLRAFEGKMIADVVAAAGDV